MEKLNRREALQKGGRLALGGAVCAAWTPLTLGCANEEKIMAAARELGKKIQPVDLEKLKITIIYDNNPYKQELRTDWGFSCLIEGLDATILFDTGRYDTIFMSNLTRLGIDGGKIGTVFLSHEHQDHVGGLQTFLEARRDRKVYVPQSFTGGIKKMAASQGAAVVDVADPVMVTRNCLSSGEMRSVVKNEHSLVIDTSHGLVVITGCAHPGICDIVERSLKLVNKKVLMVLGGFHLGMNSDGSIRKIAARFQEMGVRYVGPTHCTGQLAQRIFQQVYGDRYLSCGAGRIIHGEDLCRI